MSEKIIPEEINAVASDVENKAQEVAETIVDANVEAPVAEEAPVEAAAEVVEEAPAAAAEEVEEKAVEEPAEEPKAEAANAISDLADKTLAELSEIFEKIKDGADSMAHSKEAEAVKSAFYKLLGKLKGENGEDVSINNPFEAVEQNFKAMYADYKKDRAEFNKQQEAQREENLVKKQGIIEELKALVDNQEDVSAQFPAFRELQNRWREAGPVPATAFRDLNDTYQFYVEKFYDMVKINRELRDLDFKKNLEAKEAFCAAAEKLAENENVVSAFNELQKLHEQWKEFGPVAKEFREDIWNRFKAATAVINKKYQAHFEGLKGQQEENLAKKAALCEKVEAIADKENIGSGEWNTLSKQIEEIQAEWRTIGYATKKDNQKIYDRFRSACDKFFTRKRDYYNAFKDNMNENLEKKLAIIEQAEELKASTEWKKATDQFIALQKQWKEIGAVPRKKSEQLWKRFRAACDEFFAARDKEAKPENDFYANLKAKKALVAEIEAYVCESAEADAEKMKDFAERWQAIGHVPFKAKDSINASYREAMQAKFPEFSSHRQTAAGGARVRAPKSPKDTLMEKYKALQQDITTYENNIGFFSASKNSEPLIKQMQQRIEEAKAELKELEAKIREEQAAEEGDE